MSQFVQTPTKALPANEAVAKYLRVKLLSTGKFDVAGVSDASIGTLEEASGAAGDMRSVRLKSAQGTRKMVASGAIAAGAPVYAAASGKISATANGYAEGVALEAAGANNDVIEVLALAHSVQKTACGQATTVTATDTIATGLNTVVAVVASFDDSPVDDPEFVSATIGDQAGTPVAGSFILKTWKNTGGTDPTPLAATTFSKKVNWIAIGT
jgi:hypothetical protein